MTGVSGRAVSADGVGIAWRLDGPASAPTLLLCSMATAALGVWNSIAEALAQGRQVLRYDRRGEGDSDPGDAESHSLSVYVDDAILVLDACRVARASVCGMAFGARVASRLARDRPERVETLMLFDATGGPPAPEDVRRQGSREAASQRRAAGLAPIMIDPQWFARRDPAGAGLLRRALEGEPDWTPGLETIRAPTLIACGAQDPNLAGARRMAREIPNAVFQLMPMTGHASILDRPDLVLALMQDFLEVQTC
jgi:3-oxoadipate enol-lactonase